MAKESEIQSLIIDHLAKNNHFFVRLNNIPPVQKFADGSMKFRKMPRGSMLGLPDIMVITDGGYVCFLECKKKGTYQSKEQRVFQQLCKERGAEYYVVRSVEDVMIIGL